VYPEHAVTAAMSAPPEPEGIMCVLVAGRWSCLQKHNQGARDEWGVVRYHRYKVRQGAQPAASSVIGPLYPKDPWAGYLS
jgi:hypothetical protein